MIIDWLVSILVGNGPGDWGGIVGSLFGALPDAGDLGLSALSGLFPLYNTLAAAIPFGTIGTAVGIYVGAALAVVALRAIITVWAQVPVVGGHG